MVYDPTKGVSRYPQRSTLFDDGVVSPGELTCTVTDIDTKKKKVYKVHSATYGCEPASQNEDMRFGAMGIGAIVHKGTAEIFTGENDAPPAVGNEIEIVLSGYDSTDISQTEFKGKITEVKYSVLDKEYYSVSGVIKYTIKFTDDLLERVFKEVGYSYPFIKSVGGTFIEYSKSNPEITVDMALKYYLDKAELLPVTLLGTIIWKVPLVASGNAQALPQAAQNIANREDGVLIAMEAERAYEFRGGNKRTIISIPKRVDGGYYISVLREGGGVYTSIDLPYLNNHVGSGHPVVVRYRNGVITVYPTLDTNNAVDIPVDIGNIERVTRATDGLVVGKVTTAGWSDDINGAVAFYYGSMAYQVFRKARDIVANSSLSILSYDYGKVRGIPRYPAGETLVKDILDDFCEATGSVYYIDPVTQAFTIARNAVYRAQHSVALGVGELTLTKTSKSLYRSVGASYNEYTRGEITHGGADNAYFVNPGYDVEGRSVVMNEPKDQIWFWFAPWRKLEPGERVNFNKNVVGMSYKTSVTKAWKNLPNNLWDFKVSVDFPSRLNFNFKVKPDVFTSLGIDQGNDKWEFATKRTPVPGEESDNDLPLPTPNFGEYIVYDITEKYMFTDDLLPNRYPYYYIHLGAWGYDSPGTRRYLGQLAERLSKPYASLSGVEVLFAPEIKLGERVEVHYIIPHHRIPAHKVKQLQDGTETSARTVVTLGTIVGYQTTWGEDGVPQIDIDLAIDPALTDGYITMDMRDRKRVAPTEMVTYRDLNATKSTYAQLTAANPTYDDIYKKKGS